MNALAWCVTPAVRPTVLAFAVARTLTITLTITLIGTVGDGGAPWGKELVP